MAEIVNLRSVRKQKARESREQDAAKNRAAFGRSKAEKQHTKLEAERAEKALDALKRDE